MVTELAPYSHLSNGDTLLGLSEEAFRLLFKESAILAVEPATNDFTLHGYALEYWHRRENKYPVRLCVPTYPLLNIQWRLMVEFTRNGTLGLWQLFTPLSDKQLMNDMKRFLDSTYTYVNRGVNKDDYNFRYCKPNIIIELKAHWKDRGKSNYMVIESQSIIEGEECFI